MQRFGEPALAVGLGHYRAALDTRRAEVDTIEAVFELWAIRGPLADPIIWLGCWRGVAELTGLVLATQVVDSRRFPSARSWFTGLVHVEYSSGERTRRSSDHQG